MGNTMTQTDELSTKQVQAISALLDCRSIAKAAEKCGVTQRTLYRWLKEETFSREYRSTRREAFSHAASLTQKHAPEAVETLVAIMNSKSTAAATRVAAATAILKFGREAIEIDDVAARVDAVERKVCGTTGH